MKHTDGIDRGLASNQTDIEIARKIYLTYPTSALIGLEEIQFEILNEISEFFSIPITSIQVVGSAKIGHSFYKNTKFAAGISDLDIAIIDTNLYVSYVEAVFKLTKGFTELTLFTRPSGGNSTFNSYKSYLTKGMFRPDLMPSGVLRANWRNFFGKLSQKHTGLFKSINAGIYLSHTFFEHKQRSAITDYINIKAQKND